MVNLLILEFFSKKDKGLRTMVMYLPGDDDKDSFNDTVWVTRNTYLDDLISTFKAYF